VSTQPRTVVYRGRLSGATAFREMLENHGVDVAYDPPLHTRNIVGDPEAVTIYYLCTAPDDTIDAAKAQFAMSRDAGAGSVTVESSDPEARNGNGIHA
jgi:hypothetical protein